MGYLTSSTPPDTTAAASGRSSPGPSRGTAVSGVSLVGEDGRRLPPPPGIPGGGGVAPLEAVASSGAGVGGGRVDPGREGGGGKVEVLTRVAAVEEPWQSIYLWSLLFVKTTADLRLFDSREVRLFEVSFFFSFFVSAVPETSGGHWTCRIVCTCVCLLSFRVSSFFFREDVIGGWRPSVFSFPAT